MDDWTHRRTSCDTVYTHKDITRQVVVNHRSGIISWGETEFDSVKEAKRYAESSTFPDAGY